MMEKEKQRRGPRQPDTLWAALPEPWSVTHQVSQVSKYLLPFRLLPPPRVHDRHAFWSWFRRTWGEQLSPRCFWAQSWSAVNNKKALRILYWDKWCSNLEKRVKITFCTDKEEIKMIPSGIRLGWVEM
jgi:hypothetical protein